MSMEALETPSAPVENQTTPATEESTTPTPTNESEISDGLETSEPVAEPGNEREKPTPNFKGTKHKVKIDGEELEIDYDELVRNYSTNKAITQRAQEAAKLRKEVEQERTKLQKFLEGAKTNKKALWELAKSLGHDPSELAEELVWEKLQYERMTPEQREIYELRRERNERLAADEDRKRREKADEDAKIAQKFEGEIEDDVLAVVELVGKKATPTTIARIAEIYQNLITAKKVKPSREEVAQRLRRQYDQERSEYLPRKENVREFLEGLDKDTLNELNQVLIDKAKKQLPGSPSPSRPSAQEKSPPKPKPKAIGLNEFFDKL